MASTTTTGSPVHRLRVAPILHFCAVGEHATGTGEHATVTPLELECTCLFRPPPQKNVGGGIQFDTPFGRAFSIVNRHPVCVVTTLNKRLSSKEACMQRASARAILLCYRSVEQHYKSQLQHNSSCPQNKQLLLVTTLSVPPVLVRC